MIPSFFSVCGLSVMLQGKLELKGKKIPEVGGVGKLGDEDLF